MEGVNQSVVARFGPSGSRLPLDLKKKKRNNPPSL